MADYRFTIPEVSCGGCVASITRIVQAQDPAAEVKGDPATKIIDIRTQLDEAALRSKLGDSGFPPA